MTSEANPESPREIIALMAQAMLSHSADVDGRLWQRATAVGDAQAAFDALAAAGYEITKLEQVDYVKVERVTRDFQTVPPRTEMTRRATEPLYRKV